MFEKVAITDLHTHTLIGLDTFSASQALVTLLGFVASESLVETFRVDGSAIAALRRAAASVTNTPKDRTVKTNQWFDASKGKSGQWVRIPKGKDAPKDSKVRTVETKTYSGEALRSAVATLRETKGISIDRLADRTPSDRENGYHVVALTKTNESAS